MKLMDRFRHRGLDSVTSDEAGTGALVWHQDNPEGVIAHDATLQVPESQIAVLTDGPHIADAFTPGSHTLNATTMPILSTVQSWDDARRDSFNAKVVFVTTLPVAVAWRLADTIEIDDEHLGNVPVAAGGGAHVRILSPVTFLQQLAAAGQTDHEAAVRYLNQLIAHYLPEILAGAGIDIPQLVKQHTYLGPQLLPAINENLANHGLSLSAFSIDTFTVPPPILAALIPQQAAAGPAVESVIATQPSTAEPEHAQHEDAGLPVADSSGPEAQSPDPQAAQPDLGAAAAPTPPPLPADQWYLGLNGQQTGPFDSDALREHVRSGIVQPQTLVWKTGMPQWKPAREIPEVIMMVPQPAAPSPE